MMRPNWILVGLIASLVVNLFLIGAVAGVIALGANLAKQSIVAPRVGTFVIATEALPQPDRRNFRQMLLGVRMDARPETDKSLALRTGAWGAIADAKPDVAAIEQKLAQSRTIDIASRATAEEKVVSYAAGLPQPDRSSFAAGMIRALTPPPRPTAPAAAKP
jgi:uncharacterized membrane protein